MEELNWITILLIMAVGQGFFLAMVLPKMTNGNRVANITLSILLVIVSLSIVVYLAVIVFKKIPMHAIAFLDTFAYMYAPLIYLYFRKLIAPPAKDFILILTLFLPALVHFLYVLYLFSFSKTGLQVHYSSGFLKMEMVVFFIILVSYTSYCIFMSIRLLRSFHERAATVVSFRDNVTYLLVFLVALCIGYLISIVFALHTFFGIQFFSFTDFYIGWMIIPFLVYTLAYIIVKKPEALQVTYLPKQKIAYQIPEDKLLYYKERLLQHMETEQAYLNPKLTLQELALSIDVTPTKLSKVINTVYRCNFYDFVNQYRITAFMEKLKNNEHETQTFMALAYDVGFNSKTTFNKTFKKAYHTTPSEYLKTV